MENNKVQKNYLYNVIYQLFAFIAVLITTPYISKVLGANAIGIYGYTYSIVTYFILIGSLGISLYGQREIAYVQDNKEKRSKVFYEIIILKFSLTILSMILFYILFCINGDYTLYYKILMIELFGNGIDIIWLFQGLEEFKKVVIRNIFIRVVILILMLLFVKSPDDLWKYILMSSASVLLANLTLWLSVPKYITKVKLTKKDIFKHLKPAFLLFVPQIAIQVYTVLDKTMIGLITDDMVAVGIYQKSQELARLGVTIVVAFGTVIFPRMANCFIKKQTKELNTCIKQAFNFLWILGLPITIGLMAISKNLIPWFLGGEFLPVIGLLPIFSLVIIIIGLNNVVGMQYLIATKQQKYFSITVAIGASLNLIFNFILIGKYSYYGAVIATLIAETSILAMEFYKMRDIISEDYERETLFKCLTSSTLMFIIVVLVGNDKLPIVWTTLIEGVVGVIVYFGCLIILKEKTILDIISKILKKIRR